MMLRIDSICASTASIWFSMATSTMSWTRFKDQVFAEIVHHLDEQLLHPVRGRGARTRPSPRLAVEMFDAGKRWMIASTIAFLEEKKR